MSQHRPKIAITGAAGYVAQRLIPSLNEHYELVLLDARPLNQVIRVDLADPASYRHHLTGCAALLHLAYQPPTDEEKQHPATLWRAEERNLTLAFAVFQAAQEVSIARVVVASSVHADDAALNRALQNPSKRITPTEMPHATSPYGWAKIASEELGFLFASGAMGRSLEVVCIRLGRVRPVEDEPSVDPDRRRRDAAIAVRPADLSHLVMCALANPIQSDKDVPHAVVYGVSQNQENLFDLESGRRQIGYQPAAPDLRR